MRADDRVYTGIHPSTNSFRHPKGMQAGQRRSWLARRKQRTQGVSNVLFYATVWSAEMAMGSVENR